jgi:hypothetical protein
LKVEFSITIPGVGFNEYFLRWSMELDASSRVTSRELIDGSRAARQMSLANVLAVSQAAKSIVLLGDPQQLEQPVKGSHPDGAAVSALYLVAGAKTISPDKGLFLKTWRLHPKLCDFTSEVFYKERLHPRGT